MRKALGLVFRDVTQWLQIRCRVSRVPLRWPAVHRVSRATDVLIAAFIASIVFASLNLYA